MVSLCARGVMFFFFFFSVTSTPEIYTRSLHAALPIFCPAPEATGVRRRLAGLFGVDVDPPMIGNGSDELLSIALRCFAGRGDAVADPRSEVHTIELQSPVNLVRRLLPENKAPTSSKES